MAYIYKITNLINGKKYIGKTSKTVERRWNQHISDSKKECCKDRPLYRAFNKYGIENFSIEIIEECKIEQSSDREQFWIKKLNTYKNGYNATKGGDGSLSINGDKIYKLYQSGNNVEQIHNIMGYDKGTIAKWLDNQGITQKDRRNRADKAKIRPIEQLDKDTGEVINNFVSIKEAYSSLGKQHSGHIASVCNGKRKVAYGYKWRYK